MALFISVEGGEGAGKSTVCHDLVTRMQRHGIEVVATFEPGATPLGARLRDELFRLRDEPSDAVAPWTETFLFLADRSHHVENVIRPALARGAVVVSDRFADSTIAYQGYGRRLEIAQLKDANRLATGGLTPNLTILLDLPVRDGLRRSRPDPQDRIGAEALEFHIRVAEGYQRLAMAEPERIKTVDAAQPLPRLLDDAWALVEPRLLRQGFRLD